MAPAETAGRRLRADAERNRERILAAAREAFAQHGLDVGFHVIAARAGVGVGTVYRRFGDRDALVEALFEDRVDEAVAIAERALADPDAWAGLATFLRESCRLQARDRGLHQVVYSSERCPRCAAGARERIAPLVARMVARAQEQGTLRGDVAVSDVGALRQALGLLVDGLGDAAGAVWPRMLEIVLDGLRAERAAPSPLPGRAPSLALLERRPAGRR